MATMPGIVSHTRMVIDPLTMGQERYITHVIIWQNGMVMVFDQYGEQMPEYQGRQEEMIPKIRAVYSGVIEKGVWGKSITPMLD